MIVHNTIRHNVEVPPTAIQVNSHSN